MLLKKCKNCYWIDNIDGLCIKQNYYPKITDNGCSSYKNMEED